MYEFKEYPKYIFHKSEEAKIVNSKEEQDELGKGWQETPFETPEEQAPKAEESTSSSPEEIKGEEAVTYKEHMANWESKEEKAQKPKNKKAK